MLRHVLLLVVVAVSESAFGADAKPVSLEGPTIIGVVPPAPYTPRGVDDGALLEAVTRMESVLAELRLCLQDQKPRVELLRTQRVVIAGGRKLEAINFVRAWNKATGVILAKPSQRPRVFYASMEPSTFHWLVVNAAAEYFGAEQCRRPP